MRLFYLNFTDFRKIGYVFEGLLGFEEVLKILRFEVSLRGC